jgi:mRNA deadenylase 3'-5' endonuclease subunit Ccr4
MSRLTRIRAEILHLKSSLHDLSDDQTYHPWMKTDRAAQTDEIMTRLRKLKQQEFMLSHHSEPLPTDLMALPRQHYTPEPKDINIVIGLLLVVAFLGMLLFSLMAAAGVLTQ